MTPASFRHRRDPRRPLTLKVFATVDFVSGSSPRPVFRRRQLRETGGAFLDGLLSGIDRKTGWMMAKQAGLARPWWMQGLLGRNRWDADGLRDEVRAYAVEALGCPDSVLVVVDETGFVKKGRHSVGVARLSITHILSVGVLLTPGVALRESAVIPCLAPNRQREGARYGGPLVCRSSVSRVLPICRSIMSKAAVRILEGLVQLQRLPDRDTLVGAGEFVVR